MVTIPPWLQAMRDITGTKEYAGGADNPIILSWRDFIGSKYPEMKLYCAGYTHDSIPWCGLTMAYCMAKSGVRPVFGPTATDRFLWAAAWRGIGEKLSKPKLGCVMVFTRDGGGHVALYEGEDATRYQIRGGNQSDGVTLTWMAKSKFSGAYWPAATQPSQETTMPNYRSLVGGFFSDTKNASYPAAIRYNNPGAINGNAAWVKAYPGFVGTVTIGGGNPIAIMETPEQGVALWWQLLNNYRAAGAKTIKDIIWKYGGGQENYTTYARTVAARVGVSEDYEIKPTGDDDVLLKFFKEMARYEAGKPTPLSDAQIRYGFELGRQKGKPSATDTAAGGAVAGGGAAAGGAVVHGVHAGWGVTEWVILALVIVAVCVAGYFAWRWWKNRHPETPVAVPDSQPVPDAPTSILARAEAMIAENQSVAMPESPKAKAPKARKKRATKKRKPAAKKKPAKKRRAA